jgi:hypothetical protein
MNMYCDAPTTISHVIYANEAAHAQAGYVTLLNGAGFEITVPHLPYDSEYSDFADHLRKTDRIQMCFGIAHVGLGNTEKRALIADLDSGFEMYEPATQRRGVR